MYIINLFKHLDTVMTHRHWVRYYCRRAGHPVAGLKHDLSKYSPTEFFESVKYYQGTSSPINACRNDIGYSKAWLHHKGRNKHHYEYWLDIVDDKVIPIEMPEKYLIEMLCDYLGAARAYMGKNFSYLDEYDYWHNRTQKSLPMHITTFRFIERALTMLMEEEQNYFNKHEEVDTFKVSKKTFKYIIHTAYYLRNKPTEGKV